MRRSAALVVAGVVAIASVVSWRCRAGSSQPTTGETVGSASRTTRVVASQARPDARQLPRATIAGTVRDERGAPIANARVCVRGHAGELADELLREPLCTTTARDGGYAIAGLLPAMYFASAAAPRYQPAAWGDDLQPREIRVRGGERRDGIDLVLHDGGIELAGTVSDLTGGPIEKARVWADAVTLTETDAKGSFSLWVKPGSSVLVRASAEGYADSLDDLAVPRAVTTPLRMDIVLTPESSLAGTVIDAASGEPIAGARVLVGASDWGWDSGETTITDERGAFRVSRLIPKRYVVVARTSGGFGRTEGSLLVGLAQHVDNVVVKVFPAFRIDGRILTADKQDCERGLVALHDRAATRFIDLQRAGDGSHFADGVLPGTYEVTIYCPNALVHERYEPIAIRDRDATGLVWQVDAGATIRGRVITKAGPVADATVTAARDAKPRERNTGGGTASRRDGTYRIEGLAAGAYKLSAESEVGVVGKTTIALELVAGAVVERDLVIDPDAVGELAGSIVDVDGRAVGDATVTATPVRRGHETEASEPSSPAGTFSIAALRPGDYLLTVATRAGTRLRKPGATDDSHRGERIAIRVGETTTARLVVESLGGTITGTVVDAKGQPIADAFITSARHSDAAGAVASSAYKTRWNWNEKPVLTSPEGAFTLTNLAPGKYAIRAYRRGGGEAIAEHVSLGAIAKLVLQATGTIAGTVRRPDGSTPNDFAITIRDFTTGYRRREAFYRTAGAYQLDDLPKGTYVVSVDTPGGSGQLEVELAEGQLRRGVDVVLDAMVALTGRVVEYGTTTPVKGITMIARRVRGGGIYAQGNETDHVSDETGRFTIANVPPGNLLISGWGNDDAGYATVQAYRAVTGTGTVEIGDVPILKRRLAGNETPGELGIKFAEQPLDLPPARRERRVSYVDPDGPAARSGIEVGDVVVSVDGIDVRGENAGLAHVLLTAPAGTRIVLGLARGTTASIVLAVP